MPTPQDTRVREASKPLFGNTYRLELLAIIAELDGSFYARQIAERMDVADNLVTSQLARLCELGLLERRTASRQVLYTRNDSRAWEMAKQLRAEFANDHVGQAPADMREHVVAPSEADVALLERALTDQADDRALRELPGSPDHAYLDGRIEKPWGYEYRVYDDALVDVWEVRLMASMRTSLHAHARKDTLLLCLEGDGVLSTSNAEFRLAEQTVVRVEQGAAYRTSAETSLRLIQIELPRDKFDILRFQDDNGRAAAVYEGERWVSGHPLPALIPVLGASPRARLRHRGEPGGYLYGLESGVDLRAHQSGVAFAISLDMRSILRREPTVLAAAQLDRASSGTTYLTIRDVIARADLADVAGPESGVEGPRIRRRMREHERTLYTDAATARELAGLRLADESDDVPRRIALYDSELGVVRSPGVADVRARDVEVVAVRVAEGWGEIEVPASERALADEVLGFVFEGSRADELSADLRAWMWMLRGTNVAISVPASHGGRLVWAPYPGRLLARVALPGEV